MLKSYLKKIFEITDQGDAREESYYSTLAALMNKLAESFGKGKIHITTVPGSRGTACILLLSFFGK